VLTARRQPFKVNSVTGAKS